GGSLIYYASLCHVLGRGRVIGIDVQIRPHNRKAIESHPLAESITLVEGDAIAPETVARVKALIKPGERTLVVLDSCHSRDHVLAELRAYSDLVSAGSYIVATDGIMQYVAGAPGGKPDWTWNNPSRAAEEFARERRDFVLHEPALLFNESRVQDRVTYWPAAYLKRVA